MDRHSEILLTGADITTWLPGDSLYDSAVTVPKTVPAGKYHLEIGLVDPASQKPRIKLAIEGRGQDGWYLLGKIEVR